VIELEGAIARVPPVALAALTVQLEAGTHALLGGKGDGPSIVLGLIAGRLRLRGGSVRVLGSPAGDPRVRPAIAYVPLDAVLPDAQRVEEALEAAASIRGEAPRDPVATLTRFGVGALARRVVRTLSRDEVRTVALAEALTSTAKILLLEEPLAALEPQALGAVTEALETRARNGACVVVATGSTRDARALAGDILTFDRGNLVRHAPSSDPLILAGPRGASVRVLVSGEDHSARGASPSHAQRLAASLAGEPAVRNVAIEADVLVVSGAEVVEIASAIARVALREGIALEGLRAELLRDEELRAAIAGDAAGAYRAAYERALGPVPRAQATVETEEGA
jgi:ABC-type multidrug transport system ATPase subunit